MLIASVWHQMRTKKKYNALKAANKISRENEIKAYGKLVSLRPSKVHKSIKEYKRNKFKYNGYEE